ncbi:MAG TPA: hypothetical protein VFD63_22655 [Pyrinomonadaceae bacterium]|nr:hypothetical protein [Pyrinomonadaceae bacterium]
MRRFYWIGPIVFVAIIAAFAVVYRSAKSPKFAQTPDGKPTGKPIAKLVATAAPNSDDLPVKGGCPDWGDRRLTSTNANINNVKYFLSLGRVSDSGDRDEISLAESRITEDIYTPDVLGVPLVPIRKEVELIRDTTRPERMIQGYIAKPMRQIKAPEALVDIVVKDEWEYEVRFFKLDQIGAKENGIYTTLGQPFSVSRIRNPNPPNINKLEITKSKDGTIEKSEYNYDAESDTWLLVVNGVEQTRKVSVVNPKNPCERIETRFDLEDGKLLKTVKIYKAFPWGQEVVKKTEDADGKPKTTIYKYFDDINGPHYTFLKTTIEPNGKVVQHNTQPDPLTPNARRP